MLTFSVDIAALLTMLGILSIPLIIWAFRGRKVCDHPYCRRCGFDLFGRPPTSVQCSECGAELDRPKAIRVGRWERRRWPLALGSLLLALTTAYWIYTAQLLLHLGAADKPTWWLLMDAGNSNPAYVRSAAAELVRRHERGRLSTGDTRKLVDHLLGLSSKGSFGAFPFSAYRQVIEDSHGRGVLTAPQWHHYWQHKFLFSLRARRTVGAGDPLPMLLDYRLQAWWSDKGHLKEISAVALEIGGITCPVPKLFEDRSPPLVFSSGGPLPSWQRRVVGTVPANAASSFKPGDNKVALTLELLFVDPRDHDREIIRTRVRVETLIAIAAPGQSSTALVTPAEHRQAVQSAIRVRPVKMAPGPDGISRVHFSLNPTIATPVPIAAQVLIRTGREEKRVATFCNIPDCRSETSGFIIFDNTPAVFDVVLRPDPTLAADSLDAMQIWGDEIVIPAVTVEK